MPSPETPDRLTITDLQNNDSIEAMFNPNALTRRIAVNYAKKAVLGNSHQEHDLHIVGLQIFMLLVRVA